MGYKPHAYLTFGGVFGTVSDPLDIWSSGFRVAFGDADGERDLPSVEECEAYVNDVALPALRTWFADSTNGISGGAMLTWVKCNAIDPDGKYANEDSVTVEVSNPPRGGGASNPFFANILQAALVVTLETGKNRGYAHRGRIYLPAPNMSTTVAGIAESAGVAPALAAVDKLIRALNKTGNDGEEQWQVVVASKLGGDTGAMNTVTGVSADLRLDVQRSRANKIRAPRITRVFAN